MDGKQGYVKLSGPYLAFVSKVAKEKIKEQEEEFERFQSALVARHAANDARPWYARIFMGRSMFDDMDIHLHMSRIADVISLLRDYTDLSSDAVLFIPVATYRRYFAEGMRKYKGDKGFQDQIKSYYEETENQVKIYKKGLSEEKVEYYENIYDSILEEEE